MSSQNDDDDEYGTYFPASRYDYVIRRLETALEKHGEENIDQAMKELREAEETIDEIRRAVVSDGRFEETEAAYADIDATVEIEYRGVRGPDMETVEQDLVTDFKETFEDTEEMYMDGLVTPDVMFVEPRESGRGFEAIAAVVQWTRKTRNRQSEGLRS